MLVKFLEQFGIFLFINSLLIVSQMRWAQKNNFNDIELRITMSFVLSIIVYYGIMKILVINKINSNNVSFALSFSILAIYLNSNQEIITLLIIIALIYLIKKYKYNSLFEYFWNHNDCKIVFNPDQGNVRIINNSKKDINIFIFKYFILELIKYIIYCKENKISKLIIESKEVNNINDLIKILFNNFNIEVEIVKEITIE